MKRYFSLVAILTVITLLNTNIFDLNSVYYGSEKQSYQDQVMGELIYTKMLSELKF